MIKQIETVFLYVLIAGIALSAIEGRKEKNEKNSHKWDYVAKHKGPGDWSEEHETCGGINQSPIAFWDDDITVDEDLKELRFQAYDLVPRKLWNHKLVFENNGHTLKISLPTDYHPTISGGNLKSDYRLVQIHFHWGAVNSLGSEHTYGDDHFPLEVSLLRDQSFGSW